MQDHLKLSADQCRAISVHLIAQGDVARGHWFEELSEIAAQLAKLSNRALSASDRGGIRFDTERRCLRAPAGVSPYLT